MFAALIVGNSISLSISAILSNHVPDCKSVDFCTIRALANRHLFPVIPQYLPDIENPTSARSVQRLLGKLCITR